MKFEFQDEKKCMCILHSVCLGKMKSDKSAHVLTCLSVTWFILLRNNNICSMWDADDSSEHYVLSFVNRRTKVSFLPEDIHITHSFVHIVQYRN